MTDTDNKKDGLRHRAEKLLGKGDSQIKDLSFEEVASLVHDLRVHQVELELQNEELRRTQRSLHALSNKYMRLYDDSPAGYLTVDQAGLIVQANKTFADMVMVEGPSLTGTSLFNLIYEEDRAEFVSRYRAFHKNPANKAIELRFLKKHSRPFYSSLEGKRDQGNEEGGQDHLLLVVNDISQKKEAEEKIREQKTILQTILDGIPDLISLQHPDHSIISYNQAGCRYLGLRPDEVEEKKCFELLGRTVPCTECAAAMALSLGKPQNMEKQIPELGRWFQVRAIPILDHNRRPKMILEQMQDIDQRKKAELALVENENKYRRLVHNSIQGLVVAHNKPARVAFASWPMEEICGYSPAELKALSPQQLSELIHPEDRKGFFDSIMGKNRNQRNEFRIRHKSQGLRWVEIRSTWIDFNGAPAAQTVFLDITERKKAEAEQRKLELELQHAQKMEAIGTLAGGIAHDFNNLLQAINGYTQIILMGKEETDPDYSNLAGILKAGDRAAQLIKQMLLFSRKIESDRKPINVNREIEQARRLLERTLPKMVDIEVHCSPNPAPIMADSVQFEQVLLNLGSNAADAMPDGGKLVIETGNVLIDEQYVDELLGVPPGRYVQIMVSDTGCGMDKEVLEHIFEPFYTTKDIGKGTGLGLASVYGIVKSHSGFINCYSEVGKGSVFKIYLPAASSDLEDLDYGVNPDSLVGGSETILLVDDEKPVRDFASQLLQKYGYSVLQAASGEEALRIFHKNPGGIDLVILDISMPGMGGHRCLQEILKADSSARVLISSGYSLNGMIENTLNEGASGFIGKPYQISELLQAIRSALEHQAPHSGLGED